MTQPFHPSPAALELALLDAASVASSPAADLATAAAATLLCRIDGRARRLPPHIGASPPVVDAALATLAAMAESPGGAQRRDLAEADRACAALYALGAVDRLDDAVDQVVALIRAFPDDWANLSDEAAELLSTHPPLPDEPVLPLWQAVAQAGWQADASDPPEEGDATLTIAEMMALGIDAQLPWTHLASDQMAAADALPAPGPWERLLRGDGWELALTVDPTGAPIALLAGVNLPAFSARSGAVGAEVREDAEGLVVPLTPGAWTFVVGDRSCRILLGD